MAHFINLQSVLIIMSKSSTSYDDRCLINSNFKLNFEVFWNDSHDSAVSVVLGSSATVILRMCHGSHLQFEEL